VAESCLLARLRWRGFVLYIHIHTWSPLSHSKVWVLTTFNRTKTCGSVSARDLTWDPFFLCSPRAITLQNHPQRQSSVSGQGERGSCKYPHTPPPPFVLGLINSGRRPWSGIKPSARDSRCGLYGLAKGPVELNMTTRQAEKEV